MIFFASLLIWLGIISLIEGHEKELPEKIIDLWYAYVVITIAFWMVTTSEQKRKK